MKTLEALKDGRVYIRKAWKNANKPGQVGVQFVQEIDRDLDNTPNNLISVAQGTEGFSKQRVTAIMSFKEEIALKLFGSAEFDLSEDGEAKCADDIFGGLVSIKVTENFSPNPYAKSHAPKINPSTGQIVTGRSTDGTLKPVYRHTELVQGEAKHTFIVSEYESVSEESVAKDAANDLG